MKKDITLEEVMITPLFETNFNNALRDIEQRRANVLGQGTGLRLKSSAYSSLKNRKALSLKAMVLELDLILLKKSALSSIERQWIKAFMRGVVAKTLNEMRQAVPKKKKTPKKNEQNN